MRTGCALAFAAAALAAPQARSSATPADVFKGKVTEGQYEVKSDVDLSGVPGVPRNKQKSSETRSRCVTRQEIDQGVSAGTDCAVTSYTENDSSARIEMKCKDGKTSEMKYSFTRARDGFWSETITKGKDNGVPFVSVFRSDAKRVGPCLGAGPAGKAPAPK